MYQTAERAEAAFPVAGEVFPSTASALGVSVWPNPVGGRVAVGLTLAEAGPVRVVVVDALGRRVAVLHDGPLGAGAQTVGADAAGWPPGVYAVRVEASGRVATARLVVVR